MKAFIKKEITENIRTKKILILLIVFIALGIMSPLFAKLTPEILKLVDIDAEALHLSTPTALDSFVQFFKNVGQMGLIILAIVYSGLISNEFTKGTLINILTKGVKRSLIILSKFIVASLVWLLIYYVSFAISYGYTCYYFDISVVTNVLYSTAILCLFGILLISCIILGGIVFKNTIGSLMTPLAYILIMFTLSIVNTFETYNPLSLATLNMRLITGEIAPNYLYSAVLITVIIIIVNISSSIAIFNKMEMK